jgi:hypothetical protein
MLMRNWLSGLFQVEADGAGESAASGAAIESVATPDPVIETTATEAVAEPEPGQPDHAANVAFVKEWAKTADADTVSATITTTDTNKELPVERTSTDAVSDDDAAASSGNEQDDLLLNLAEAYDFTREELKGISNEGLTSLIAREKRRQALVETPAETVADTTPAPEETPAGSQVTTFDQYAQAVRDNMEMQGHDEDTIERQVQIEKMKWGREEALRQETQWVRQQFEQERRQQFEASERQGFFDIVAKVAKTEKGLLPLPGQADAPPDQVENLNKWWQSFNLVKQSSREVQELARTNLPAARAKAAHIAFSMTFPEVVVKRGQRAYADKQIAQANRVMGSPRSAKAPENGSQNGNPWDSPAIVRHWNKMVQNKS